MIVTTPPAPKPEPLSKSVSTSLTATDEARLTAAAQEAGVSKAAFLRTAVLARLDGK